MCKVLACDLDGTLFYPKKVRRCIPVKNVRFLRKWIDAGNRVVLVTSRTLEFVKKLEEEIKRPIDIIANTASQIYHDGKVIKESWMPNEELKRMLQAIDEKYKPLGYLINAEGTGAIIYNTHRKGAFALKLTQLWYFFQFKYREPGVIDNELFKKTIEEGKVYKLMTFFGFGKKKRELSKEINKELRENFPDLESSWSLIVNEITPKGCNKGDGLKAYCEALNINHDDVIVIGDSGNDIAMFNAFHENSYCMAHAYPSVKKYAKHVVSHVYKLDKFVLKGDK